MQGYGFTAQTVGGAKKGSCSLTRFAPLDDIDLLVTDPGLTPEDEAKLKSHGIEVVKTGV